MPREFTKYEPDWIDVNTQLTALGEDFHARIEFRTTIERDYVVTIARCFLVSECPELGPICQALSRKPLKSGANLAVICFALAQDCWRQLDAGNSAIEGKPLAHSWNGRPHVTRR
jgi:hypothetical protein